MSELEELEQAIAALESQRATLGDAVVDASQAALREKLAALSAGSPPERQRRQVTVLFMDVVGSTAIIRQLDPEDNLAIVDGALQQLAKPIVDQGGRVVRFMGDGLMALFGHPRASEKDPDLAVRAGLAILDLARDYARQLEERWGITGFNVRVGISTGLVAIGSGSEGQDTLAGTAVNLAARLESAASPGTLLISTDTYRHIMGAFDLEPGEAITAKGFAEPVPVYRVLGDKPRSFRTRRRGVEGIETRMIGRRGELRLLQDLFTATLEEGQEAMVTVVGDAGIGKSRLLYEFEKWVDLLPSTTLLFRGRAYLETQGQPYGLLRDIFVTRFGVLDDDPIQVVREKTLAGFTEVMGSGSQTQMKANLVGDLLGYGQESGPKVQEDPRQVRDRALAYVIEYFKAAAASAPVLLLLEDMHWADDSSLDMLAHVMPAMRGLRWFMVGTTRPVLYERYRDWGTSYTRLDLKPLSNDDSAHLLEELLQKALEIPPELRRLVVEKTDGNPFYVEELVKMLVDDGIIVKGEEFWQVYPERLGETQAPSTLTGVLQARLASLSPEERTVIEQASVVGRVFWDETIGFLNDSDKIKRGVKIAQPALTTLLQREMIFQRASSTFKDAREHIFKHALMHQVTYESVLRQARQTYHSLTADWLIGRSGERQEEFSGLIANHLERAGRIDEAITYLDRAGRTAAARYANEEAIEYYSQALSLTPKDSGGARYSLLLAREALYKRLGRREKQRDDLHALASLAERSKKLQEQLEITLRWATFYENIGDYELGVELAASVVSQAQEAKAISYVARGRLLWASLLLKQGRYEAARSYLLQALDDFRQAGDLLGQGKSLNHLGGIAFYQGDFPAARDYYEQALNVFREIGDRGGEAFALNNLGNVAVEHGNYDVAWQHYEAALAINREIHRRYGEELVLGNLASAATWRGDPQKGHHYYQQGLEIANEIGDEEGKGWMFDGLGETLLLMGKPKEAAASYRQALAIREELGQKHLTYGTRAGLARSLLALGETEAAKSLIEPVIAHLGGGGSLAAHVSSDVHLACVQSLIASDDPRATEMLQTAYRQLQERADKITDPAMRRSFLENIPWNQEIGELWQATTAEE